MIFVESIFTKFIAKSNQKINSILFVKDETCKNPKLKYNTIRAPNTLCLSMYILPQNMTTRNITIRKDFLCVKLF